MLVNRWCNLDSNDFFLFFRFIMLKAKHYFCNIIQISFPKELWPTNPAKLFWVNLDSKKNSIFIFDSIFLFFWIFVLKYFIIFKLLFLNIRWEYKLVFILFLTWLFSKARDFIIARLIKFSNESINISSFGTWKPKFYI